MSRLSPTPSKFQHADFRTLGLLALLTSGYAWLFVGGSFWILVPCTVLAVTACVAKHNHTHRATFGSRWLNRLFDLWLTLLTGTSTTGIRVAHQVLHHGRNQSPDDLVRVSLVAKHSATRALLTYVPLVVRETWKCGACNLGDKRRGALYSALLQERFALWIFITFGLILDWQRFLITFPLPWLVSQWFLVAVNLPQHDGCDASSQWAHSRDVVGRWGNWLFLNNGFHAAHHERPSLHWSLLPAWHQQHLAAQMPKDLQCNTLCGLWMAWWKYRSNHQS